MTDKTQTTISKMPVVTVRIEPNAMGSKIIWRIESNDGTKAHGLANCPAEAMRNAAAFVEAMMQPRVGGLFEKPELKVVK